MGNRAAFIAAKEKVDVDIMKGDLAETKRYWTLAESSDSPVVGVGGAAEEQGQARWALEVS